MAQAAFSELSSLLKTPSSLITDLSGSEHYLCDASVLTGESEALVMAECEEDVINTVNFARNNDFSIVPRGAGTGLSGGCVPQSGSIVLSTERIAHLKINPERKMAIVGPGVITKQLQDEAAEFGLAYPPDPASYDVSTLGGNVAEGAGGLRCKRFGVTKDYVLGLKGITAAGEAIETGSYTRDNMSALTDILIASEGTLVIMTEIALRLIDEVEPGETFLVAFDSPTDAAQAVTDITGAGIIPTVMEYLDGDAAECSNKFERTEGLDQAAALLLIEIAKSDGPQLVNITEQICIKNKCSYMRHETDPASTDQLWKVRRNLSRAVKQFAKLRVSEDVAVPISRFPELIDFAAQMNKSSTLRINSFGHAGDGNLHVNFLSQSDSPESRELIEKEIERLLRKTVELGGTITGEHGVGIAKRRYLSLEFDQPTVEHMHKLKEVFDPEGLLNPGKIFLA